MRAAFRKVASTAINAAFDEITAHSSDLQRKSNVLQAAKKLRSVFSDSRSNPAFYAQASVTAVGAASESSETLTSGTSTPASHESMLFVSGWVPAEKSALPMPALLSPPSTSTGTLEQLSATLQDGAAESPPCVNSASLPAPRVSAESTESSSLSEVLGGESVPEEMSFAGHAIRRMLSGTSVPTQDAYNARLLHVTSSLREPSYGLREFHDDMQQCFPELRLYLGVDEARVTSGGALRDLVASPVDPDHRPRTQ